MSKNIERDVVIEPLSEKLPRLKSLSSVVDTLVVDYSSVAMQSLATVLSKNYTANEEKKGRTPVNDAMEEWYYQISRRLLTLSGSLNPSRVVIALDSKPYWRTEFVERYYRATNSYYWSPYDNTWIVDREGSYFICEWDDDVSNWIVTNLTKAKKEEYGCTPDTNTYTDRWFFFPNGEFLAEDKERAELLFNQALPVSVYDYPHFTENGLFALDQVSYPYKHGRKWAWNSVIDKAEFVDLATTYAQMVAPFMAAENPVKVDFAEADDIVHSVCKTETLRGRSVAVATVDSDLQQLVALYPDVFFVNLRDGLSIMDVTKTMAQFDLDKKLLGGDTSDKIRGARKVTRKGEDITKYTKPMSETVASNFVGQFRKELAGKISSVIDPVSYAKNVALVDLRECPSSIQEAIEDALNNNVRAKSVRVPTADGTLTPVDLSSIQIGTLERGMLEADCVNVHTISSSIVEGVEIPSVVEAPSKEPSKFRFVLQIAAHPTDDNFPAWETPEVIAEHPQGAIQEACDVLGSTFSDFVTRSDNGWMWWVCPITIVDNGKV